MPEWYRHEEEGKVISGMQYDILLQEEKEKYAYVGWHGSGWKAEDAPAIEYRGARVRAGQKVTGIFETRRGALARPERFSLKGTVQEENRNYFTVRYEEGLLSPLTWRYWYAQDVGRTVFPRDEFEEVKG